MRDIAAARQTSVGAGGAGRTADSADFADSSIRIQISRRQALKQSINNNLPIFVAIYAIVVVEVIVDVSFTMSAWTGKVSSS